MPSLTRALPGLHPARRALLRAGIALLVTLSSAACSSDKAPGASAPLSSVEASTGAARGPVRVIVERPSEARGDQELVLPGTVEAWEKAALFSRVTGYLETVFVDLGDQVESGAEIARVVAPETKAELRSAEARVNQERAERELAGLTKTRLEALRQANPEAISQQDVDVAAAKERIEAAQLGVAEAARDRLRTLVSYAKVQAPFTGRVSKRHLHPGALVREGTSAGTQPIVDLVRTDRLRLAFNLPEPLAPRVRAGTKVALRFDAFPGREVQAEVARVSGVLDESTRTMRAEIELDNEESRYAPGMYASVRLSAQAVEGALTLPSRAVRGQGDERYALVVRDELLERVPVVVASDDGRSALVAQGLTSEDRVVVSGSPLAREGSSVEAVEESAQ